MVRIFRKEHLIIVSGVFRCDVIPNLGSIGTLVLEIPHIKPNTQIRLAAQLVRLFRKNHPTIASDVVKCDVTPNLGSIRLLVLEIFHIIPKTQIGLGAQFVRLFRKKLQIFCLERLQLYCSAKFGGNRFTSFENNCKNL